jgi:hypothetical protein
MESSSEPALEFQDGISHPAAKPQQNAPNDFVQVTSLTSNRADINIAADE